MAQAKRIKPKPFESASEAKRRLERVLKVEAAVIATEFDKTTATWKDKPDFKPQTETRGGDLVSRVEPTGSEAAVNHFVWTDLGTKPHIIRAKNAPRLAFRTGFTAKTKAKTIGSGAGGVSGPLTRPLVVNHLGTEPRLFTQTIVNTTRQRKVFEALAGAAMIRTK